MAGQNIVSTALDTDTLERLDAFCELVHRKRSEVLRGLLYALVIEGKQFIYEEWRERVQAAKEEETA
ncbi:MAG: hypothetical protein ACM3JB_22275 [Acidobacteriaceae bacterium]